MGKPTFLDFGEDESKPIDTSGNDWIKLDQMMEGVSNRDYHSTDAISSTQFKLMRISMTAYDNRRLFSDHATIGDLLEQDIDPEMLDLAKSYFSEDELSEFAWNPKAAFATGNLYHDCVLLPHIVKESYLESPTIGLDTDAAIKLRDKNPDKIVVGNGEIKKAIKAALMVHINYGKFIRGQKREVSFFHKNEENGLLYKFRPDIYFQDGNFIVILDLKSSTSTNHKEFLLELEKYDYDLSAAWYYDVAQLCGYKADQFGWIVVPKSEPHIPFAFYCTEELLEKGREKYQTLLAEYLEFKASKGEGYDHTLFKPAHSWAFRKEFGDFPTEED